jgi:hypothetical protein
VPDLSCQNERKGAIPVPGPTRMMGVEGEAGREKSEWRTNTFTGVPGLALERNVDAIP